MLYRELRLDERDCVQIGMQISQRQVRRSARRDWQSAGTDTYPLSAGNGCLSLNTNSDWIPSWWWQAPRVWPRDLPTGINGRTVNNFRSTTSQLPPPLDVGVATWIYDKRLAIDFYLALYFPNGGKRIEGYALRMTNKGYSTKYVVKTSQTCFQCKPSSQSISRGKTCAVIIFFTIIFCGEPLILYHTIKRFTDWSILLIT